MKDSIEFKKRTFIVIIQSFDILELDRFKFYSNAFQCDCFKLFSDDSLLFSTATLSDLSYGPKSSLLPLQEKMLIYCDIFKLCLCYFPSIFGEGSSSSSCVIPCILHVVLFLTSVGISIPLNTMFLNFSL